MGDLLVAVVLMLMLGFILILNWVLVAIFALVYFQLRFPGVEEKVLSDNKKLTQFLFRGPILFVYVLLWYDLFR